MTRVTPKDGGAQNDVGAEAHMLASAGALGHIPGVTCGNIRCS
jgi:hypothetical protein